MSIELVIPSASPTGWLAVMFIRSGSTADAHTAARAANTGTVVLVVVVDVPGTVVLVGTDVANPVPGTLVAGAVDEVVEVVEFDTLDDVVVVAVVAGAAASATAQPVASAVRARTAAIRRCTVGTVRRRADPSTGSPAEQLQGLAHR